MTCASGQSKRTPHLWERPCNLKNVLLQFEGSPIHLQLPKAFDPLGHLTSVIRHLLSVNRPRAEVNVLYQLWLAGLQSLPDRKKT